MPLPRSAGIPVELLPLLLAVDTIPDIFYTISNVTADLAVTSVVGRGSAADDANAPLSEELLRSKVIPGIA